MSLLLQRCQNYTVAPKTKKNQKLKKRSIVRPGNEQNFAKLIEISLKNTFEKLLQINLKASLDPIGPHIIFLRLFKQV